MGNSASNTRGSRDGRQPSRSGNGTRHHSDGNGGEGFHYTSFRSRHHDDVDDEEAHLTSSARASRSRRGTRHHGDVDNEEDIHHTSDEEEFSCASWVLLVVCASCVLCLLMIYPFLYDFNRMSVFRASEVGDSMEEQIRGYWTNKKRRVFVGETQRIEFPRSTRRVRITALDGDRDTKLDIFRYKNKCPPLLKGYELPVFQKFSRDLEPLSFKYFVYNMNPGSSLDVGLAQHRGTTSFYLLKGTKALEEIESKSNLDPRHWEKIAVQKANVPPYNAKHVSYKRPSWDEDQDNIYTLVYDNPSQQKTSEVDVQTEFHLTTHDLDYKNRVKCEEFDDEKHQCTFSVSRNDCIIVEGFEEELDANDKKILKSLNIQVEFSTNDAEMVESHRDKIVSIAEA